MDAAELLDVGLVEVAYLVAASAFVLGLKRLGRVRTARSGNVIASLGMLLAIATTLWFVHGDASWWLIGSGLVIGTVVGAWLARTVAMTAMPELVGALNGLGGAASVLVALAEVTRVVRAQRIVADVSTDIVDITVSGGVSAFEGTAAAVAVVASVLIGAVTASGSAVAWAKLAERTQAKALGVLGARWFNALLLVAALVAGAWLGFGADAAWSVVLAALLLTLASLALGLGLVLPIGGADMPVVISLLNSYSGVAAAATGFILANNLLIVAGALVGASGLILTRIMCRAMNRSLANVLFAGYAPEDTAAGKSGYTGVKSTSPEELALLLEGAQSVIVVPGYGLAVAQAQHKVRELATLLEKRGATVRYAIHPVAGRMPGHMNVLLAEADVPYEALFELDAINGEFAQTDVAIVLGANDVCNPAAIRDPSSPIAGMPVLHVWEARTVVVVKRSLGAGYAGIKNPLFEGENTLMLFSDAKAALEATITELKAR